MTQVTLQIHSHSTINRVLTVRYSWKHSSGITPEREYTTQLPQEGRTIKQLVYDVKNGIVKHLISDLIQAKFSNIKKIKP